MHRQWKSRGGSVEGKTVSSYLQQRVERDGHRCAGQGPCPAGTPRGTRRAHIIRQSDRARLSPSSGLAACFEPGGQGRAPGIIAIYFSSLDGMWLVFMPSNYRRYL